MRGIIEILEEKGNFPLSLKSICKREKSIDNIIPGAFRGFLYDKTLSHGEGPSENIHLDTSVSIWYNKT